MNENIEKNALVVAYEVGGVPVEMDMPFVKKYLVRGRSEFVDDKELLMFMHTCKSLQLNPLVGGEIHLIKYQKDDPAQIVVGKYAYMKRAYDHPEYIGNKNGITVQRGNEIVMKEGTCVYPTEILIGGWCKVFYKRNGEKCEEFKEVSLAEYNKGMANWKSKPATMINKVAISQCMRDAFPKQYEGIYSEDEMIASGVIPAETQGEVVIRDVKNTEETAAVIDEEITQEDRRALFNAAFKQFGRGEGTKILQAIMAEFGIESTDGMRRSTYNAMIERIAGIADEKQAEEDGYIEELAEPIEAEYTDIDEG